MRKLEAQLLKEGFNVVTVNPDKLHEFVSQARIIGIHTMDPFGIGPASSTLAAILKKEPFLANHFRRLLSGSAMKKARANGAKIVVGGPGAWQFHYRPRFAEKYGIDCVIEGEAENIVGNLFRTILKGGTVPKHLEVEVSDAPVLSQIPDIVKPSVNGLVEIGRGCCRGCEFCNVTLRPLRWYPFEKIFREMNVNLAGGVDACCLHAEDVMLYGSKNTLPDGAKLLRLHELVTRKTRSLSWSHCSLAAVASSPKLFAEVSETVQTVQNWWGAEVGIETGSPRIAQKIMPAKAHPFKAQDWPDVVRNGMGLMHDNMLIPACTLIVGLPQEREEDVIKTMELIDDVKGCRSLIVPLFFVPLGRLKNEEWFKNAELTDLHKQSLFQCAEHDFFWLDDLIDLAFGGKWYTRFLKEFYKVFAGVAKRRTRQVEIEILP